MTISSLLSVFRSTRGRLPALRGDQPLLDQRRKLEAAADFVDDGLFTQFVDHGSDTPCWVRISQISLDGTLDVVVEHLVLIAVGAGQFAPGYLQPPLDGSARFGPAAAEPALQLFHRTGAHEDGDGLRIALENGHRTLDVNL